MPSVDVLDGQPPAAAGEIAHAERIRDWHAGGRGRARTWRSPRPPRRARASVPPDRSRRRRTGMALLAAWSASAVILSPQLSPDCRSLTHVSWHASVPLGALGARSPRVVAADARCTRAGPR